MPRTAVLVFFIFLLFKGDFALECGFGQYLEDIACKECTSTCAKCISEFLCTECKDGFFGEACTKNCSESCFEKRCVKETGDCLFCNKGYYLSVNKTCVKCPESCRECLYADKCTKCKTGNTGSICQKLCVNCKPDSGCSLVEGICSDGCKDGYSGRTCFERCNSNCFSCDRIDANKCTSCVEGKYGQNCEKACPTKCIDNSCSKDTGACTHGCQNGFWGDQCEYMCPENCRGGTCLRSSGHCSDGCTGTFTGTKCFCPRTCDCDEDGACKKCDDNMGFVCDKQCRSMCLYGICSSNTERKCFYGCKEGYEGSLCIKGITNPEVKTAAWKIVVPIFATAAVLTCVVLSVLIKKRGLVCRRKAEGHDALKNDGAEEKFLPTVDNTKPEDQEANPYCIIKDVDVRSCDNNLTHLKNDRPDEEKTALLPQETGSEGRTHLLVEQIKDKTQQSTGCLSQKNSEQGFLSTKISINKLKDMTSDNITDEFKRLSASTEIKEVEDTSHYDTPKTAAVAEIYQDIFHACYVDGYRKTETYIACACPGFNHKELFWNMVWKEGCDRIVMLSDNNIDDETAQYWPKQGDSFKHGELTVKCLSMDDIDDDFKKRELVVKMKEEEKIVLQLHFTSWPENLLPRSTSLIEFQKYRDKITSEKIVPVVVHCSDGIGRTGTYIAFDRLVQEGKATGSVDVFECVKSLREQRRKPQQLLTPVKSMVQTHEHYSFLYEVLQSWFKPENDSKKRQVVRPQTVDSAYIHMGELSEPDTTFNMFSLLKSLETS